MAYLTGAVATEESVTDSANDVAAVEQLMANMERLKQEIGNVIVGMDEATDQLLISLLCRGHCILEGVPGLAKTLMISTIASLVGLSFKRIQFTPDLMPSDITGSEVLEEDRTTGQRVFRFIHGPIFANIILADEINRTPPKTQSALLEAMQERQVTVGGGTLALPDPFFVLATQNPIEQEGTYPLPEAQLDRFMMKIHVRYPATELEEIEIARRATTDFEFAAEPVLSLENVRAMQSLVRRVPVGDHVYEYAARLTRLTRPEGDTQTLISWGAGPRGCIFLLMAAKARALLCGRFHATTDDVRQVALPVLRHRIVPTFNAEVQGKTNDDLLEEILAKAEAFRE
jgi:MoxR-like ATPase